MPHGRKPKPSPWSARLQAWDKKYSDLYRDAIVECAALSFEEAADLKAEIAKLGQTNCPWTMYHAAKDMLMTALPHVLNCEDDMEQLRRNALQVLDERRAASELAPHSPTDQEVEDTYQAVLGRIAGEVRG